MNTALQTIRERAASSLDVASAATSEAAHAAFLSRLASEGFTPPEECIIAVNTLAGTELPLSLDGQEEIGSLQRVAVEAFSNAYWSLEPAKRRTHWQELTKEASDIQAKSRLAGLEGGLDQIEKEHPNALVNEIATAVRELYVLGQRDRAVRRTSWLAERCDQFDDFREAARRFRVDDPELAKLEPEFLREISRGVAFEPVPAIDSGIAEAERSEWATKAAARIQERIVKKRVRAQIAREESKSGGSTNSTLVWIILPIVIGVIRLFIGLAPHTDRTTPTYPTDRNKTTQDIEKINSQLKQITFTKEEIQSFIAYEREKAAGTPPLNPPLRYSLWVLVGRPGAPADPKPKVPR